jgi:hypothetical protein
MYMIALTEYNRLVQANTVNTACPRLGQLPNLKYELTTIFLQVFWQPRIRPGGTGGILQ